MQYDLPQGLKQPPMGIHTDRTMTDHYSALRLAAHASLADIKKPFGKRPFYHPDKNDAPDAAQRFAAVQRLMRCSRTRPLAKPMTITADATCWTTSADRPGIWQTYTHNILAP